MLVRSPDVAAEPVVTRLRDLSGYGAAKDWGLQLAADLRAYRAGEISWADVDKGVLLTSPPGCGKSYFAGALAAECGIPLVVTTYNDWHSASSGDTVSKTLTKLFGEWRKKAANGPIMVFWDEIDSIGKRGTYDRADYWYAPIINAWLAFLDGAVERTTIMVVAATNFPDRVDDALKRPGRLEKGNCSGA
jgi:cell division protease FtsH